MNIHIDIWGNESTIWQKNRNWRTKYIRPQFSFNPATLSVPILYFNIIIFLVLLKVHQQTNNLGMLLFSVF